MRLLAIGIPAYKSIVDVKLATTLLGLGGFCGQQGLAHYIVVADVCFVSHARNVLLHKALNTIAPNGDKADWLLMMDADVFQYSPAPLIEMIAKAEAFNAMGGVSDAGGVRTVGAKCAVIAAPVMKRGGELNVEKDGQGAMTMEWVSGKVREVHAIGTACMAINLDWMRANWPEAPWFTLKHGKAENGEPTIEGEDYTFCRDVRAKKGIVLCDGRFMPGHVKGAAEAGFREVQ